MWEVTLITRKQFDDKITFVFDTVSDMSKFIDMAVKASVKTLEINIKYKGNEKGEE